MESRAVKSMFGVFSYDVATGFCFFAVVGDFSVAMGATRLPISNVQEMSPSKFNVMDLS